ncbi:MAG: hypothetical protein AAFR21_14945 [Pseudomonadota bacterium]
MNRFENWPTWAKWFLRVVVLVLALSIASSLWMANQASAQTSCTSRDDIAALLKGEKYGEAVRFLGLDDQGASVYELWVNEGTGSWTVTRTTREGCSQIMIYGNTFDLLPAGIVH